jgi:hypothetical protein
MALLPVCGVFCTTNAAVASSAAAATRLRCMLVRFLCLSFSFRSATWRCCQPLLLDTTLLLLLLLLLLLP